MDKPIFVASGSYGCVIKPGYTCSKKHTKQKYLENTISKLFPSKKEWLKEIELQEIVQNELDPSSTFTIKMIDNCELKPVTIKNTKNIEKCSLVNEKQFNNIYQIIYEYGGVDVYNIIKRHNPELTVNLNIINALHSFISIMEGLKTLAIKNYVHHDIKLDNILYDFNKNKFILIDFGFLMNIKKTYNYYSFLFKDPHNLTFKFFPPEYNIMFMAYNKKTELTKSDIYSINLYEFSINYIPLLNKINSIYSIPKAYKDVFLNIKTTIEFYIYTKSKDVLKLFKDASEDKLNPTIENIDNYLKDVSNKHSVNQIDIRLKIDTYMIGLFLLSFITNAFIYLDQSNRIFEIPIKFFDLILKMIDINPFTRISIYDAINEYNKIFKI